MSNSNIPSLPVDNAALINAIVNQINANTNTKATETQEAIVADGDITQEKLNDLTTVNGDISTEVQAINQHVTDENNRVLANIPSNSPIKSIQRGVLSVSANNLGSKSIAVSLVDRSKSFINILSVSGQSTNQPRFELTSPTEVTAIYSSSSNTRYAGWELIEYV
ncbi:MAG: hypothetical protein OCD00_03090 [Colwellia sp.]